MKQLSTEIKMSAIKLDNFSILFGRMSYRICYLCLLLQILISVNYFIGKDIQHTHTHSRM